MAIVRLDSGINCDYVTIDGDRYAFGYDIARKPGDTYKGYGKEVLPTVEEVLKKYPKPYTVIAGNNRFTGKSISEEDVEVFRKRYIDNGNI